MRSGRRRDEAGRLLLVCGAFCLGFGGCARIVSRASRAGRARLAGCACRVGCAGCARCVGCARLAGCVDCASRLANHAWGAACAGCLVRARLFGGFGLAR